MSIAKSGARQKLVNGNQPVFKKIARKNTPTSHVVDSNDKSNENLVSSKSTDSHLLQLIKVYAEEKGKMKKIQKCKIENKETNSDLML